MSNLETLKAEHPEWCFRCGYHRIDEVHKMDPTCDSLEPDEMASPVVAALLSLVQQHEATIAEQQRRLEQQDKRLDHLECIGVDAYDHARELMEKAQRERSNRGVEVGTIGSLCDGIAWVYRRLASVESDLSAVQSALEKEERDCLSVIAERDLFHEKADDLTEVIACHLGADFGEHSSANSPWDNAIEALDGTPSLADAQAELAAALRSEVEALRKRNEELEQRVILAEQAQKDDLNMRLDAREFVSDLYAERGQDARVAYLCNRALALLKP